MRRKTIISLVLAVLLIMAGGLLFVSSMTIIRWDFHALATEEYETNTYSFTGEFHNITMNTDTADILFLPSDDGRCTVVCYEATDAKHAVAVVGDTLTIELEEDKSVSEHIIHFGINFESPKITIYLPKAEYKALVIRENTGDIKLPLDFCFESMDLSLDTGDVACYASVSGQMKIKTGTGNIHVENVSAEKLDLRVSTGGVHLEKIQCHTLHTTGSTGDILLKNVIAADTISIRRTTGDVEFAGCDAPEIFVETDTGNVTGSLLTGKTFVTETDTGTVRVPQSTASGRCEIITSTGDIRLQIA